MNKEKRNQQIGKKKNGEDCGSSLNNSVHGAKTFNSNMHKTM